MLPRLILLAFLLSAESMAQSPSSDASATNPLDTGIRNPLEIPVPEAAATTDQSRPVRDPGAASRELDTRRASRFEQSTQRFRPSLPSRQNDSSVDARAQRRQGDLRRPGRFDSRAGRLGF